MGGGSSCVRILLGLVNFIFFLTGAFILAVGVWLSVDKTSFTLLTNLSQDENLAQYNDTSAIEQGGYVMIAVGSVILLIGFLGCCGSVRQSQLMLGLYGGVMLVVFLLYVAAVIFCAVYKQRAEHQLQTLLRSTIERWYSVSSRPNTITVAWNLAMIDMSCCGVNNYTDFRRADKWSSQKPADLALPHACCRQALNSSSNMYQVDDPECLTNPTAGNSFYLVGCYHALKKHILERVDVIIGSCVVVGALQLCLTVLSFCLCKMVYIQKERY